MIKFLCYNCNKVVSIDECCMGDDVSCGNCHQVVQVPQKLFSKNSIIDNDYIVIKKIGQGGMGIVYLAHQISLNRPVALKVLNKKYSKNKYSVQNLINEARSTSRVSHPNIVHSYAITQYHGIYFIVMEFINGHSFQTILKKKIHIPIKFAVSCLIDICKGLDLAWKKSKIIHCDIKPDNIMLTSENIPKLMDLGLSHHDESNSYDTNSNQVMGTPQYIAPEMLINQEIDCRCDLYSLGATFYHILTGKFVFTGKVASKIAHKHLEEIPTPPIEHRPNIPQKLNSIILKLLEKHPDDRYDDFEHLLHDLELLEFSLENEDNITEDEDINDPINEKLRKKKNLTLIYSLITTVIVFYFAILIVILVKKL